MRFYLHGTIEEERPDLAKQLVNREDGRRYHIGSAAKLDWVCPNCGAVAFQKSVNKVVSKGIPCPVCKDGVSRPEKIVASSLRYLNITYQNQKTFTWSKRKRYDFYLPDFNLIIEVNGSQHYGLGFKHFSGVTLDDQLRTDREKFEIAVENGISDYFIINATDTSIDNIVSQLENILARFGVNKNVDRQQCELELATSYVKKAASLFNNGFTTTEIRERLGVCEHTIIQYLKRASTAGLCSYSTAESQKRCQKIAIEYRKRQVRCINTGEIFNSLADACRKYGISSASNIIRSCQCAGKHAGVLNGEKLAWEYVV